MPDEDGLWTLDEANASLFTVEAVLREAQAYLEDLRAARTQMEDLRIVWGESVHDQECEVHTEFRRHADAFQSARRHMQDAMERLIELGVEVKDLDRGLIDFPSRLGNDVVLLCWRRGEPRVAHYHDMDGGFAGRRPVPRIVLD